MHAIDVKIDDHEIDMNQWIDEESEEYTVNSWRTNYIEGIVKTEWANNAAVVTGWMHGVGYAYNQRAASRTCSYDAADSDDCYEAKVVPTITGLSASTGLTSGGQVLTITGTSLKERGGTTPAVVGVTVDGSTCTIDTAASTATSLVCTTGTKTIGTA
jgi:hypothetical protein